MGGFALDSLQSESAVNLYNHDFILNDLPIPLLYLPGRQGPLCLKPLVGDGAFGYALWALAVKSVKYKNGCGYVKPHLGSSDFENRSQTIDFFLDSIGVAG